jgi:hypothetical protein
MLRRTRSRQSCEGRRGQRSQPPSLLYQAVHRDEMTKAEADRQLSYLRAPRIRLLGDRVLQNVAWKVAGQQDLVTVAPIEALFRSGQT